MNQEVYDYDERSARQYIFISAGREEILKSVRFDKIGNNLYNLVLGDLSPDNSINDASNSNNGDMRKTMATVISIIGAFTEKNPQANILFTGEPARVKLYRRILKTHHAAFSKEFMIWTFSLRPQIERIIFDPASTEDYNFFLIKRI